IVFATPSDAVEFALRVQAGTRKLSHEAAGVRRDRIGIPVGEGRVSRGQGSALPRHLYGIQVDAWGRVMSLAKAGEIVMTRAVFDMAPHVLKGEIIDGVGRLEWFNHGRYVLKGLDEPVELCEVREAGQETGGPPTSSDKVHRQTEAVE